MSKVILEICCADIQSVLAANEQGADRIELCSVLGEGGITPSAGFISEAVRLSRIPVKVLIRPREGNFIYTPEEVGIMTADIRLCRQLGAAGVVIGALCHDGSIDTGTCRQLVEAAAGTEVSFHRAFDLCNNPMKALRQIIDIGCNALLTSGGSSSASEGCDMLARLVSTSGNRLKIIAAAGITSSNVAEILKRTGVSEVHASAKMRIHDDLAVTSDASMGQNSDETSRFTASPTEIRNLVNTLS